MKKKSLGRTLLKILLALVVIVAVVCAIWHQAAYAVFKNLTVPVYKMDESPWTGGTSYERLAYAADSESQYVDLYVPDSPDGTLPKLFVIIHGGGFISNDSQSRQAQWMFRYFRDHGYACASVNYRLAQEEPFPGAVCDCKAAIRFLRANAETYGYDAEHIAVFGESAGGYLATMCAVTNDAQFHDVAFLGEDKAGVVSGKVDVLVDYYGHVENGTHDADWKLLGIPRFIITLANSWIEGDNLMGFESVESFWARKNFSEMTAEEKAVLDPYTYLAENDVRDLAVWIIHGDCDITVPYVESLRIAEAYQQLGAKAVKVHLVPGMGHASDPLYADEILSGLDTFLQEHLA